MWHHYCIYTEALRFGPGGALAGCSSHPWTWLTKTSAERFKNDSYISMLQTEPQSIPFSSLPRALGLGHSWSLTGSPQEVLSLLKCTAQNQTQNSAAEPRQTPWQAGLTWRISCIYGPVFSNQILWFSEVFSLIWINTCRKKTMEKLPYHIPLSRLWRNKKGFWQNSGRKEKSAPSFLWFSASGISCHWPEPEHGIRNARDHT